MTRRKNKNKINNKNKITKTPIHNNEGYIQKKKIKLTKAKIGKEKKRNIVEVCNKQNKTYNKLLLWAPRPVTLHMKGTVVWWWWWCGVVW